MLDQPGAFGPKLDEWERSHSNINIVHLLNNLPLPLMVLDSSARVTFISSSLEALLGRSAEECQGCSVHSLLHDGSEQRSEKALAAALEKCLSGGSSRARATFSTPRGAMEAKCTLIPTYREEGNTDGAVLILQETSAQAPRTGDQNIESSIQILARTSVDIIENADLAEIIEEEVARLVESLDLDFAAFRLLTPDDRPLMLCHGIDYRAAREVLETRLRDGSALYMEVCRGKSIIIDDAPASGELRDSPPGVGSLACLTVHWSNKAYGCAVFGTRDAGKGVRDHYPILQVFCNQVGISLRNAVLYRELKLRNTQLRGLYETSKALSSTLDLQEVLKQIVQTAMGLVDAENCFIFQLNPVREKLTVLTMVTRYHIDPDIELSVGEGITGLVARTGKGILVERADLDERSKQVEGTPEVPSSIICVPLKFTDRLLGVMTLEKTPGVPFNQKQYELIEMFSLQASLAVHNASMFEKLKSYASNLQMYNVLLTHDVANFNVPIHGFLEMLLKDPKLDDRQRRYVRSALVQSDNISELISDVRELSRLRSKLGEMPLEPVDIVPVIIQAKEDIFSNAVYEDIETTFQSTVERAEIMADAFLKDLFYNLMSNACKYGRQRPVEIVVSEHLENGKEWWKVQILDGGKGIPDERKGQLFKRFDQLDTEQGADGHGLGLSVVGALTDRYGGKVWVEDRVSGDYTKGSVFNVLLPKAPQDTKEG